MFCLCPLCCIFTPTSTNTLKAVTCWPLSLHNVILVIITFIAPLVTYRYKFTKKGVDGYYGLPIKKNTLFLTEYTFMALYTLLPWLLNLVLALSIYTIRGGYLSTQGILNYTLLSIAFYFILTSVNTWILSKANNYIDALILLSAYSLLPFIAYFASYVFLQNHLYGASAGNFIGVFALSPINEYLTTTFSLVSSMSIQNTQLMYQFSFKPLILYIIIGLVTFIAAYTNFKNHKGESAEQLSNDFFAYPFIIGSYTFTLLLAFAPSNFGITDTILAYIIIFACVIIASFIYQRKIVFPKKAITFYVIGVLFMCILGITANTTDCFGLNKVYPTITNRAQYNGIENPATDEPIYISCDTSDPTTIQELQEFQQSLNNHKFKGNISHGYLSISYDSGEYYYYYLTEQQSQEALTLLHKQGCSIQK